MIFWGIAALFQEIFIPGLLIRKLIKIRGGIIEQMIYIFPISLIFNYLLVYFLAYLRIYTHVIFLLIMILETAGLCLIYRNILNQSISATIHNIKISIQNEILPLTDFWKETQGIQNILNFILWILCGAGNLSAIFWGFHILRLKIGTVFTGWDTLLSWNSYAEIWAANKVPVIHGAYPQMVPANWSICYVTERSNALQLFNVLIPPIFFILIFVIFFDLGFAKRETGFFIAGIIARYMLKKIMGDEIADGYMDVPAAFMILLAVYTWLKMENRSAEDKKKLLFLSIVFSAGAAVTKQAGITALIFVPLFILRSEKDVFRYLSRKEKYILILLPILIAGPWYLHCLINSQNPGTEGEEIIASGIVTFNRDYDLPHKLIFARKFLGKYLTVFIFSLIGMPFIKRKYRFPFFLLSWPITIIWILFFTYDSRNLASALPFISASAGLFCSSLIQKLMMVLERIKAGNIPFWIILITVITLLSAILYKTLPDSVLQNQQSSEQRKLFGVQLNQQLLYGPLGEEHSGQDILTDYPAHFLSGYKDCCTTINFSDAKTVEEKLKSEAIHYLMIPIDLKSQETESVLEQCIRENRCSKIVCSSDFYTPYCLYSVANKP